MSSGAKLYKKTCLSGCPRIDIMSFCFWSVSKAQVAFLWCYSSVCSSSIWISNISHCWKTMNKGPCKREERTQSQILSGHMPGEMTLVQAVHLSKRGPTASCPHISIFPVLLSQQVLHSFDKKTPELLYVYWFGWFAACVTQSIINLIQRAQFERLWLSTISSVTLSFRVQKVQIAQTKGPYSPWFNSSNLPNNHHKLIIPGLNQRKIWTSSEMGKKLLG